MQFRISPILAGIVQAFAVWTFIGLEVSFLDAYVTDWMMSGNLMITIGVLSLVMYSLLILAYPIHLFRKQQKSDGIIVIASTIISILIVLGFLFFITDQMFKGID